MFRTRTRRPRRRGVAFAAMVALGAISATACRSRDASPPARLDAATTAVVVDAPVPPDSLPIDAAPPAPTPTKLVAAGDSTCVVLSDLTVRCWGGNDRGQLGNGTTTDAAAPVAPSVRAVKELQLVDATACALLDDASVVCWGQIGWHGRVETLLTPTAVSGVIGATRIFVLAGRACARLANDSLVCWGNVDARGHFVAGPTYRAPTPVVGIDHVAGMRADGAFSDDGRLWRFGPDGVPRLVDAGDVREVASRDGNLCARLDSGRVACVASERCGPRPPPTPKPATAPPTKPAKPGTAPAHRKPAKAAAAKSAKPEEPPRGEPTDLLGFTAVRQLAFDLGFCVVTDGNLLQCGDGCRRVDPPKLERVISVVGRCALLKSGTVACFDAVKGNPVPNLIRATQIAIGRAHGCAIAFNNVACWGANDRGQLGSFALGK